MDSEPVALIGYGYWGQKLYRYLKKDPRFHPVYVHFRSLKKYSPDERKKKYGEEFIADPDRIWKDDTVRNVVVATPIKTHFAIGKKTLHARKNLLMEKPLALTCEEALALERLAQEKGLRVLTEFTYTFSRSLLKAKEIIRNGEIGPIRSVQLTLKQTGRFLEYDVYWLLASHLLAILDMFVPLKKLTFSKADMIRSQQRAESGLVYFENGDRSIAGYLDVSLNHPIKEVHVVLYGEKGSIIYNPISEPPLRVVWYRRDENVPGSQLIEARKEFSYDEKNNLELALDTFLNVVRGEERDNLERAVTVTKILDNLSPFKRTT